MICDVWCTACDISCDDKLEQAFKGIYHYTYNGNLLKDEVERIYDLFRDLAPFNSYTTIPFTPISLAETEIPFSPAG